MACTTTCTNCGTCYEESSEESANDPNRLCAPCFASSRREGGMGKMAQGKLKIMGQIEVNEPDDMVATYRMALLIEFDSAEGIRKAIADNCCRYTFGEDAS
jgi:hypothetical protein